jgi:acetylornithine deacetylase
MRDSSPPGSLHSPEQLAECVSLLCDLIAYRTENPGGDELSLCRRLVAELEARGADEVIMADVARAGREPGGYVFARYGTPRLLINVHLDTVPANTGWSRDPFTAEVTPERVYGLGSADTKGAIAAALAALSRVRPENVGILFSGDEENGSECVHAFVKSDRMAGLERAIVCEPTARRAGVRHRGVVARQAQVRGQGGHSSRADHMPKPIVTMAQVALALDELGRYYLDQGPPDMKGLCMNVASIDGGVAFNVVPDGASLSFSVRPPPGFDMAAFERAIEERMADINAGLPVPGIAWTSQLVAVPFACRDVAGFQRLLGDRVDGFTPLDFWTEAAVLAAHGVDAVVVGPGDIAQAHAPDEFVTLDDLGWAIDLFTHVLSSHSQAAAGEGAAR